MEDEHLRKYKAAMAAGREIDCYNNRIRFLERDSFMVGLTDEHILWRSCILPLYAEGDTDLPNRIQTYLQQIFDSDDIIAIYVGLTVIRGYMWMSIYPDMPFKIDFTEQIGAARKAVRRNADKYKNYQGIEFSAYIGSPYDLVSRMVGLDKIPTKARPKKTKCQRKKETRR